MKSSIASAAILALLLVACGGGGGESGGGAPPPAPAPAPPAPSGLSYAAPPVFTAGTAITQLSPTVSGSPTSYSISPALPAGLTFNTTTGAISGTPSAIQSATTHTITATNAGGSTTTTLSITVNDVPPSVGYSRTRYVFALGVPLAGVTPSSTGGAVTTWSVAPALPGGITLNTSTGAITGTPTAPSAAGTYVIRATNTGGSRTFDLAISVVDPVLFELGHGSSIRNLDYSGSRILSVDDQRHVVLWNAQSGSRVLALDPACDSTCGHGELVASLAGSTLAVRSITGFDLYDAINGSLTAHIDAPAAQVPNWVLARDGSYLALQGTSQLAVWSNSGTALFTRTGNYSNAKIFAAPGQLRIAGDRSGTNARETISVPDGVSNMSAGGFDFITTRFAWFEDGERYITSGQSGLIVSAPPGGSGVIVNAPHATQEVGGYGNWYWSWSRTDREIVFFSVTGGAAPVATYTTDEFVFSVFGSGSQVMFLMPGRRSISVIDLSGASLVRHDHNLPVQFPNRFAALNSSEWVFGNVDGVVMGELGAATPQLYAYGRVENAAASQTRVSMNTASGRILTFSTATLALESEIDFESYRVRLTADGSVLAAGSTTQSSALRLYSMPSGTVISDWPTSVAPNNTAWNFDMSDDGRVILQSLYQAPGSSTPYSHRLLRLNTTPATEEPLLNVGDELARLSPSGNRIATSNVFGPWLSPGIAITTRIFTNGVLTGTTDGWAVDWLDDSRLLTNRYLVTSGTSQYQNALVIGADGQTVATPTLATEVTQMHGLGDHFYAVVAHNRIYNSTSGAIVWSSPNTSTNYAMQGAVSNDTVFFTYRNTIRAEPR